MTLILQSLLLSFGVMWRMVFPCILLFVVSSTVLGVLDAVFGGYAQYVLGPIVTILYSFFGIRVALSLLGKGRQTEYQILILYSVFYGVFFMAAIGLGMILSNLIGLLYADLKMSDVLSFRDFFEAEKALQLMFSFYAISAKAIVAFVIYVGIYAVMAVPLAGAAYAAGRGEKMRGFFAGAGQSFIPLFCIFLVAFFLQFFFNILAAIYAFIPLIVAGVSLAISQSIPEITPDDVLYGLVASIGLLWVHSWVWAASAVAFVKTEGVNEAPATVVEGDTMPATDLRALRKSRE